MFDMIINVVFWLLARICDIVLLPVTLLINAFMPDIRNLILTLEQFLTTYVFNVMRFVKSAFMNITGFPQLIWEFVLIWLASTLIIHGSIPVYKAIISIINKFKGA